MFHNNSSILDLLDLMVFLAYFLAMHSFHFDGLFVFRLMAVSNETLRSTRIWSLHPFLGLSRIPFPGNFIS